MQIKILMIVALLTVNGYANPYTLDVLCQKGLENNPKIRSFKYKTAASRKVYDQSFDRYKPTLNLSGQAGFSDYSYNNNAGGTNYNGDTYNYRATINQVLYRASLGYALDDSSRKVVLSDLYEEDEKAKLVTQILQTSFELVRLKKTIDVFKKKESTLEKAYNNIQKNYALKLLSKVDTFQSLARLQQSRSDLASVKHTYEQMLFNLKLLTKQQEVKTYLANINFNVNSILTTYRDLNLVAVKSQYHQSTRLKLDKQVAQIAKGQIDLRASERYPSFNLSLNAGDAGGTLDSFTRENEISAMVSMDFPIYQGGYVTDRKEEAHLLYLSALNEAENTEMNIQISLEKALQDIALGLESSKADTIAVEASKNYLEATVVSYKNGLRSLTDVYLAEAEYNDSEVRLISTNSAIFSALAEVYYYSGNANIMQVKKMHKKHLQ